MNDLLSTALPALCLIAACVVSAILGYWLRRHRIWPYCLVAVSFAYGLALGNPNLLTAMCLVALSLIMAVLGNWAEPTKPARVAKPGSQSQQEGINGG